MRDKIDLYLVSGFLGSGKTTFLQNVLKKEKCSGRLGVIVNEFGSIGIDGTVINDGDIKLVEINNGSIFCACLKDGFVKTLAAFLQQPIDKLYVEASGMADPSNMEQLLKEIEPLVLKKYTTDRRYDYRGCICIVDCGHFMEIVDSLMAPSLQIKKSDLVVLNKIDTVSEAVRSQVIENIKEIKPDANIYCTTYSEIPENILPTSDTQNTETAVKSINTKENRPYGAVLYLEENYEYVKMVSFFQTIAAKLYRMKGFFSTANGSFYVSGVGKDVQFSKTKSVDRNSNKVVLIGTEASPELTGWISEVWEDKVGTKIVIEEDNYISD